MAKLEFSYDEEADVLTIEGVRYCGELFRGLSIGTPPGYWNRIEPRADGTVTIFAETEDAIAKRITT